MNKNDIKKLDCEEEIEVIEEEIGKVNDFLQSLREMKKYIKLHYVDGFLYEEGNKSMMEFCLAIAGVDKARKFFNQELKVHKSSMEDAKDLLESLKK